MSSDTLPAMTRSITHTHSGRRLLGTGLAIATAFLYATIPIGLKLLVQWIEIPTLTWIRFVIAGALVAPVVIRKHGWRELLAARRTPVLVLVCVAGLLGSNLVYQSGIRIITPDTAQVIMQLGPICVIVCGLVVFRERFGRLQWLGISLAIVGLALFFNMRYGQIHADVNDYATGVVLIAVSAICYAAFALAQKQLLTRMDPETILITVYIIGTIMMLPFARPSQLLDLTPFRIVILIVVSLMTLTAYWTYILTLKHIEASRSSIAIASSPLITITAINVLSIRLPDLFEAEPLNWLSIFGVFLVVGGLAMNAVTQKER